MKTFSKIFFHIASNALAIYAAAMLVTGITLQVSLINLIKVGVVFGLINTFIRPILKAVSLPLIALTLGLFILVVNAVTLGISAWLLDCLTVSGLLAAILGTLVISLVNYIIDLAIEK